MHTRTRPQKPHQSWHGGSRNQQKLSHKPPLLEPRHRIRAWVAVETRALADYGPVRKLRNDIIHGIERGLDIADFDDQLQYYANSSSDARNKLTHEQENYLLFIRLLIAVWEELKSDEHHEHPNVVSSNLKLDAVLQALLPVVDVNQCKVYNQVRNTLRHENTEANTGSDPSRFPELRRVRMSQIDFKALLNDAAELRTPVQQVRRQMGERLYDEAVELTKLMRVKEGKSADLGVFMFRQLIQQLTTSCFKIRDQRDFSDVIATCKEILNACPDLLDLPMIVFGASQVRHTRTVGSEYDIVMDCLQRAHRLTVTAADDKDKKRSAAVSEGTRKSTDPSVDSLLSHLSIRD